MILRLLGRLAEKVPSAVHRVVSSMKPQVVFVLGGPGAGKGTQCAKIVEVGSGMKGSTFMLSCVYLLLKLFYIISLLGMRSLKGYIYEICLQFLL